MVSKRPTVLCFKFVVYACLLLFCVVGMGLGRIAAPTCHLMLCDGSSVAPRSVGQVGERLDDDDG